jgi:hypothetical protein
MSMKVLLSLKVVIVVAASLGMPSVGTAQMTYIVSIYSDGDADTNFDTLYVHANTVDSSTGCSNHYGYQTSVTVWSPDYSTVANNTGGLYVTTTIPINGVAGNYPVSTSMQAHCGCFGMPFSASGGGEIGIGISGANFRFLSNGNGAQCVYTLDCDSPPTCPRDPNTTIVNTEKPCGNYWVQQYGSTIANGTRTCYQLPNVWPFPRSGPNGARAGCT